MSSEEENGYNSDEDIDSNQHSKLIQDIIQLDKKTYVKKPTRTEPTLQVSEFNLVQPGSDKKSTVNLTDLTKSLQKKKKHVEISKKVKSAEKKTKTLPKPLEKPQRERIKRSIGYKEVKLDLGKWDPIVVKNRVTLQQHFPLDNDNRVQFKPEKNKTGFTLSLKSDLDKELEAIEADYKKNDNNETEVETFPLTLKEIMEKRREMARLRAHQSYQEAKAHRQKKIKSKKFHRIMRQEKIKNQINEFEKLQKTDPEEALRKLEELDRTRAEERMSLRHRSTGQWAKNKQIHAKYDKDSRQVLSEQLALSRQLTQKVKQQNDSSSDESEDEDTADGIKMVDPSNPWVNPVKTDAEIDQFLSGYRKFWDENNKKENNQDFTVKNDIKISEIDVKTIEDNNKQKDNNNKQKVNNIKPKRNIVSDENVPKRVQKVSKSKKRKQKTGTTEWEVESLTGSDVNEEQIHEIFDDLETITSDKIKNKLSILKKQINEPVFNNKKQKTNKKPTKTNKSKTKDFMELPREKHRPVIDDELIASLDEPEKRKPIRYFPKTETIPEKPDIDPNKFLNVQPTALNTQLPDTVIFGDDNEDLDVEKSQKELITEAFEGDDVVAEFQQEKQDEIDKNTPKDVDTTLPGWGSWGGKNIKPSKRKTKRFIRRFPRKMPRRDENKGNVIIFEHKNEKLKSHLVSEVPFPFNTVKDFEASIRAPVGDTFVPQTAFRRLIKPAVTTKKGEIIKPMDEDVLLKYKMTKNGMVVKR